MDVISDIHRNINLLITRMDEYKQEIGGQEKRICVLGDASINYYSDERDRELKEKLQSKIDELKEIKNIKVQILFVRGNHECNPREITAYQWQNAFGGKAWIEEAYPNLLFLETGQIYIIEGKKYLAAGGGYSEDGFQRIINGEKFWWYEEMNRYEYRKLMEAMEMMEIFWPTEKVTILSHMLPESLSPRKLKSGKVPETEKMLESIYQKYGEKIEKWYAGHYHRRITLKENGERTFDVEVVYNRFISTEEKGE